jgi:hypothetical protein
LGDSGIGPLSFWNMDRSSTYGNAWHAFALVWKSASFSPSLQLCSS